MPAPTDRHWEPFGRPPPRYPAVITAIYKDGASVTPPNCIGKKSQLRFDLTVHREDGVYELSKVPSSVPEPANDLDINCNGHIGAWADVWYIPKLGRFVVMVPLTEDNLDCEDQ